MFDRKLTNLIRYFWFWKRMLLYLHPSAIAISGNIMYQCIRNDWTLFGYHIFRETHPNLDMFITVQPLFLRQSNTSWFRRISSSAYGDIAIENCHRNSWFAYSKWWFSIVMLVYQIYIYIYTCTSKHEKHYGCGGMSTHEHADCLNITMDTNMDMYIYIYMIVDLVYGHI